MSRSVEAYGFLDLSGKCVFGARKVGPLEALSSNIRHLRKQHPKRMTDVSENLDGFLPFFSEMFLTSVFTKSGLGYSLSGRYHKLKHHLPAPGFSCQMKFIIISDHKTLCRSPSRVTLILNSVILYLNINGLSIHRTSGIQL